ncbi:MAG TPA: malate dehydrogenase [Spirochaetia bacterium]|nr:malate dehydrogenase [Spirochaetia bacterium]
MAGVSIVGSGNLGANTAFFIAETCAVDVTLFDVNEGISTGKALDMMEAAPLRKYTGRLSGSDSIESIKGSQVVIVALGNIRKAGNERGSLFAENRDAVVSIAREVARLAPQSVVILATEPVDAMTTLFVRESKFPRNRVIGLGGALDSARLRYLVSQKLSLSAENISAMVVGAHSDQMIGLGDYSRISGIPLSQLMSTADFEGLMSEVRKSGDEIVRLAGRTSSYYAPGAIAAELVDSITNDLNRVISVSVVLEGEYGVHDVALSLPAIIGKGGVVGVLKPKLDSGQERQFTTSAESVKAVVASGGTK